jgi:ribosomal protein L37E
MFCRKCGKAIAIDSEFCSKCGVAVLKDGSPVEPETKSAEFEPVETEFITCWRCANSRQVAGLSCSSCGTQAPEHRPASIGDLPVVQDEGKIARDRAIQSIKNRKTSEHSKIERELEKENQRGVFASNLQLFSAYLVIYFALANFLQAQSLITEKSLNFFGTVAGSNLLNLFTGGFWGGSPQLTEEVVVAYQEALGGIQLENLMDRDTFSTVTSLVSLVLVLVAGLVIYQVRKSQSNRESGGFFLFFWA